MSADPVSLALALPLLLVSAGIAAAVTQERGWLSALAFVGATALAVLLLIQGPATQAEARLSLREASAPSIEQAADALLARRDRDGDQLLTGSERHGLRLRDADGDGAIGRDDLLVDFAHRSDVWLGVGRLDPGGPARARDAPLFLPASLRLDRANGVLALLFALLGLASALHLAGETTDAGRPRAWLCLAIGAAIATAFAENLVLALAFWSLACGLVFSLQQSASLAGAPNRLGAGSFLALGVFAALAIASALLLGPTAETSAEPAWLPRVGQVTLQLALLGPVLILPFRPIPSRRWGATLAVQFGVLFPLATLLVLRAEGPSEPQPALATAAAAAAALAGLRALAETRIDRALTWIAAAEVGVVATSLLLAAPPQATLTLALTTGLALAALALGVEAIRDLAGGVELERLGGLRRAHPALCVAVVSAAAALVATPPLPTFHAQRALLGHALRLGPGGILALLPLGIALSLVAVVAVRLTGVAFRGSPSTLAGAPVRRSALPILLLALLLVGAAPLFGAGVFGPAPEWGLGLIPPDRPPTRVDAAAALLLGLALVSGLSLGAWILLGPHRQAPLAPPETARGWIVRVDTRVEELTPQRRLVQPLLRLAGRLAGAEARLLEERPARAAGSLWGRLTASLASPREVEDPAPADGVTPERPPRIDPAFRDAGLLLACAALLMALVQLAQRGG